MIVKTDESAVCSDPEIGLQQIGAFIDCPPERSEGIFRTGCPVPAMRNDQELSPAARMR
jgi:hypothetical protein